jgi:hypothetical protein
VRVSVHVVEDCVELGLETWSPGVVVLGPVQRDERDPDVVDIEQDLSHLADVSGRMALSFAA